MAAINDLIAQIEDIALRERIAKEVDRLSKQKKFGLVFRVELPSVTMPSMALGSTTVRTMRHFPAPRPTAPWR